METVDKRQNGDKKTKGVGHGKNHRVQRQMDFHEQASREAIRELINESNRLPNAVNLCKGPTQMVMELAKAVSLALRTLAFAMDNQVFKRTGVHEIIPMKEPDAASPISIAAR